MGFLSSMFSKVTQAEINAFVDAASYGHLQKVQDFLKKHPEACNARDDKKNNALTEAARWGHQPVIQTLIQAGADPLEQSADGKNALEVAAKNVTTSAFLRDQTRARILNKAP